MHSFKRRKLDQANASLMRPFRSPIRTDADAKENPSQSSTESEMSPTLQGSIYSHKKAFETTFQVIPSQSLPNSTSSTPTHDTDSLQRECATLSRQLTSLRQSLDVVQQALKIDADNRDVEIQNLMTKWKQVVRDAAEEIFETSKENFKMNSTDCDQKIAKDVPFWVEEQLNALTTEQREMLQVHQDEAKAEAEKYGLIEKTDLDTRARSQTFSMELMLQQMNIDLDLVGFDTDTQRWVD